ncbi:ABC transporter permease family protein [Tessaracoccus coleopterorum]|uniref:hypothetical protein n=1 Tax=Tessaracoccus coleopterorum TaxID=2714950 RepID=UPI001E3AB3ED|nr:hypothetical protein [Tessaracoccus coleopterorum]
MLARPELGQFARNSVVIAAGVVLLTLVCTLTAAFALAKLDLRFRETIFYFLVAALTLPTAALTVPLFITVRTLGLYNSPLAVVLPWPHSRSPSTSCWPADSSVASPTS